MVSIDEQSIRLKDEERVQADLGGIGVRLAPSLAEQAGSAVGRSAIVSQFPEARAFGSSTDTSPSASNRWPPAKFFVRLALK